MGMKGALSAYFFKWILKLIFVGFLILIVDFVLVIWGINHHFLLAANDPINRAEKIKNEIIEAEYIDPAIIPTELDYAIFNKKNKQLVESNMSSRNIDKAKDFILVTDMNQTGNFMKFESEYETILIHYNLKIQFANASLRKVLPNPGVWQSILSVLLYCLYLFYHIKSFSHIIVQENRKLIKVAQKIREKDLNIDFPQVRFNEYKDVMSAMENLSQALAKSIQKEIEVTNSKQEQISYLVHDLKIPLTIIKGNAELLEATSTHDSKENIEDIMNSIQQIEGYIQQVLDINLNNKQVNTMEERISVKHFLNKLEAEVLLLSNNILIEDLTETEIFLFIDYQLLLRAINNIILNGIERTPQGENVQIIVKQNKEFIQFIIIDHGPGFSKEALKRGSELFYTENDGRTNNGHYGLGLSFTEKVIKQHNGRLMLKNNAKHHGEVWIELPIHFYI